MDTVDLDERRRIEALHGPDAVVLVVRIARAGNEVVRQIDIEHAGGDEPDFPWIACRLHEVAIDMVTVWAESVDDRQPADVRPFPRPT